MTKGYEITNQFSSSKNTPAVVNSVSIHETKYRWSECIVREQSHSIAYREERG
jgi:hypothetical protein